MVVKVHAEYAPDLDFSLSPACAGEACVSLSSQNMHEQHCIHGLLHGTSGQVVPELLVVSLSFLSTTFSQLFYMYLI